MSIDTTVVIAGRRISGEFEWTAAVVQAADNIHSPADPGVVKWAKACFDQPRRVWFRGEGSLGRVKQFAHILQEDARVNGELEYNEIPLIEICDDRLYLLTQKGNRKDPSLDMPRWFREGEPRRSTRVRHSVTETRSVTESSDGRRSVVHSVTGSGPREPNVEL